MKPPRRPGGVPVGWRLPAALPAVALIALLAAAGAGCGSPAQRLDIVAGTGVVDACLEELFTSIRVSFRRDNGGRLRTSSVSTLPAGVTLQESNNEVAILLDSAALRAGGTPLDGLSVEIAFALGGQPEMVIDVEVMGGTTGFSANVTPTTLPLGNQAVILGTTYVGAPLPCSSATDGGVPDAGTDAASCPASCPLGCLAPGLCRRFVPANTDPGNLVWDAGDWGSRPSLTVTSANDAVVNTTTCTLSSGTETLLGASVTQSVDGMQLLPAVCELRFQTLTVEAGALLTASGSRPLRILVLGDAYILGTLAVSAAGLAAGAGGGPAGGASTAGLGLSGGIAGSLDDGGGGACFGGEGGSGGGNLCACTGCDYGDTGLRPLLSGSGGGGGGGAPGGGGGGGLQLSVLGSLIVDGSVLAGGGGGSGANASAGVLGGGGGGSGGAILLEAFDLVVTDVIANGGGGGGGSATGVNGTAGADGVTCTPAAPGAFGGGAGGAGADGAADGSSAGGVGSGGGGGAVGRVVFSVPGAAPGLVTANGCVSPDAELTSIVAEP